MLKKFISIVIYFTFLPWAAYAADIPASPVVAKDPLQGKLERFEAYAKKGMADWKIPGMAIAIVEDDKVIYEKAFGVKAVLSDDPVTVDTVFQVGSTSKAFTAALVAMLVDAGTVKWDDPAVKHLCGFMMYDPWVTRECTITDLMAQHSGMPAHASDFAAIAGFDGDHIIATLRFIKPVTSFRYAYAYQNNLFLVAAKIVEKYTNKSWDENVREKIFNPLGMNASSGTLASFKFGKNVASLHRRFGEKITTLPMNWPAMDWVYTYAPAGGVNSNVKDMAKWLRLHINEGMFGSNRIISAESMRYMHAPKTIIPAQAGSARQYYCQGWVYREAKPYPIVWHNGGTSGAKTMVAFVPQKKTGIVILSNLDDTELPEALAYWFFDAYFGNPERDWSAEALERAEKNAKEERVKLPKQPLHPANPLPLSVYAGDYSNDLYGTITVSEKDKGLVVTIGPRKIQIALRPFDHDMFSASWSIYTEKEDAGLAAFSIGPDGKAEALSIEALDTDGFGKFERVVK